MLDRKMGLNWSLRGRKKCENLGSWIIFQSGSIGGVPGGPRALKNIKKTIFSFFFEFLTVIR